MAAPAVSGPSKAEKGPLGWIFINEIDPRI
jgi:hypothetical protein